MSIKLVLLSLLVLSSIVLCLSSDEDRDEGFFEKLITSGSRAIYNTFQPRRPTPCTCGIFLESQYSGNVDVPEGNPSFAKELLIPMLPCGYRGNKYCQDKCLDEIVPHISQIGLLMCSAIERNCFRERAALFVKNCDNVWRSSGLTLGREFCCLNGLQIKCPRNWFGQGKTQFSTISSSLITEIFEDPPENRRTIPEVILDFADRAVDIVTDVLKTK